MVHFVVKFKLCLIDLKCNIHNKGIRSFVIAFGSVALLSVLLTHSAHLL